MVSVCELVAKKNKYFSINLTRVNFSYSPYFRTAQRVCNLQCLCCYLHIRCMGTCQQQRGTHSHLHIFRLYLGILGKRFFARSQLNTLLNSISTISLFFPFIDLLVPALYTAYSRCREPRVSSGPSLSNASCSSCDCNQVQIRTPLFLRLLRFIRRCAHRRGHDRPRRGHGVPERGILLGRHVRSLVCGCCVRSVKCRSEDPC
jgi:hypothetical protein